MYALATDNLIFYKISQEIDGLKLRIWEKSSGWTQGGGYLYIVNYQATSMAAIRQILGTYLASNGRGLPGDTDHSALPWKGQVSLLPHATWSLDNHSEVV
jgi:hypothetical protein